VTATIRHLLFINSLIAVSLRRPICPGIKLFQLTLIGRFFARLDLGLRLARCLERLRVLPAGVDVREEFFEPIERLGQIGQFFEAFAGILYKEFCRFMAVE